MRDTNELLKECRAVMTQLIPMHLDSMKIGERLAVGDFSPSPLMKSVSKIINQGTNLCVEIERLKLWQETK